jgi:hypothetical protein
VIALFTILSMSMNGFLPKSVMDLSGNSFLVDAISCQTVFLDFLHLSDKSLSEIAVKTADDLALSMPAVRSDGCGAADMPWASACRSLSMTTDQVNAVVAGLRQIPVPAPVRNTGNKNGDNGNTSSDYLLFTNQYFVEMASRTAMQWISLTVIRLTYRGASVSVDERSPVGLCPTIESPIGCRSCTPAEIHLSGRNAPVNMSSRFICLLPRSGIEAPALMTGIKI